VKETMEKGDKIRFKKNNINYGQDFSWSHYGIPTNKEFEVTIFVGKDAVRLKAPGFGELKGDYGCGQICVRLKDIEKYCDTNDKRCPACGHQLY